MIVTFYSYKGGVGRSMAMANVADQLARSGLRVLAIDFDLEAPGLEQFFRVNQGKVRRHRGLLDLLLSYKQAMSVGAGAGVAAGRDSSADAAPPEFEDLQGQFIVSVYPQTAAGGRLDLLPAGRREDDEQLSSYALNLRSFDWQDFYFNWAGEMFFEWLRATLVPGKYDLVLVDSRTGVTEMGGICAYQLADVVVILCAANHQNVDGTRKVVRNFFSPRVRELRRGRDLQVIVVPARVEQRDDQLLAEFRERFRGAFAEYLPRQLAREKLDSWDLMIPYEPEYAFEERVLDQSSGDGGLSSSFRRLLTAITRLVPPESPLAARLEELSSAFPSTATAAGAGDAPALAPTESAYDPSRSFARYDVFLAGEGGEEDDRRAVDLLDEQLDKAGLRVFRDRRDISSFRVSSESAEDVLFHSRTCVLLIGAPGKGGAPVEDLLAAIERLPQGERPEVLPVLLPSAVAAGVPPRWSFWVDHLPFVAVAGPGDVREAVDALVRAVGSKSKPAARSRIDYGQPYMGMRPFDESDAPLFFGREPEVEALLARVRDERLLTIAGPSGCGKSSLVLAGLFPALRAGRLPGSDRWTLRTLRPGAEPARALAWLIGDDDTEAGMSTMHVGARLVLYVDQFEEIFTLCGDVEERVRFIDGLVRAADQGAATVLVGVRSAHLEQLAAYPQLMSDLFLVSQLGREGLRAAIERPAALAGLALEPGLVDRIIEDVGTNPGGLPLVQFLLFLLWERRRDGWLTNEAYRELGGVRGALASTADASFADLTPHQQVAARRILLRLVAIGSGGEITRRRIPVSDLIPAGGDADVPETIGRLTSARFLVSGMSSDGVTSVELVHEAVIGAWPRLRDWVEENREALRVREQWGEAAAEWQGHGHDPSYLYRGFRLAQAGDALDRGLIDPSPLEAEFLRASKQAEEEARRAGAQRRQLTFLTSAIAACAIIGLALTLAVSVGIRARAQAELARKQTQLAQNQTRLREEEVKRMKSLLQSQVAGLAAATTFSPNRDMWLAALPDGKAELYNTSNGERNAILGSSDFSSITASLFGPDGKSVAVGRQDGAVQVWRTDGSHLLKLQGHEAAIRKIDFSPDGRLIATASDDMTARIWSAATGTSIFTLQQKGPVIDCQFISGGDGLITSSTDGTTILWDPHTGKLKQRLVERGAPLTQEQFYSVPKK